MSRDWYIRTDKRQIQNTFGDIDATPLTPKEKWQKNYKKYILWMVEALVAVALLVIAFPVMFPRDTADYTVTLVTQTAVGETAQDALSAALAAHGTDRNGDGEVQVKVRALTIAAAEDGARNVALEQLITSFKTDEYTLFAMEPAMYARYIAAYAAEDASLFEPLSIAETGLWEQPKTEQLPALLWGVRTLPEANAAQQAHLQLLQEYVA